ncbi:MAG: lipid-A-disaccharide synthase [Acidobacteriaceae bacterium]
MRILISAGEASGEMYGAGLIEALRRLAASRGMGEPEFFGLGGERMRAAGCDTVIDAKDVAVLGIFEVISHLPSIYRRFHQLVREAERRKPDVAVLIDFPDFNFRLAKELHRLHIPVVYYVSPQLWAWRPQRVELVKKYVRKMLVIFPFEEQWYRERGVEAEFVSHPLAELEAAQVSVPEVHEPLLRVNLGPSPALPQIALLPGSRRKEIRFNLPLLLDVAEKLASAYQFLLPVASTIDDTFIYSIVREHWSYGKQAAQIEICHDARAALAQSRAAVVASGTATVEAAVIGTPFVMVYRVAPLTYSLGTKMVKVPFYAMPNLIAGRQVVPELVQENFTADKVVSELFKIVSDGPERERMLEGLAEVRQRLRGPEVGSTRAFDNAAGAILGVIGRRSKNSVPGH